MGKCAEFCCAAQDQLHALVDIKWLIKAVCLDTQGIAIRRAFKKQKAVNHFGRVPIGQ